MPFDFYTWALALASVAGVSIALIVIDKIDSMWSQKPTKKSIFISKCSSLNSLFCLLNTFTNVCLSGIAFSLGAVIDEAQEIFVKKRTHNIIENSGSKAKILIILIWILCGYLLTLSYESVLRAMLMKTYYEKKIDSIDDMLADDREFVIYGESAIRQMMASDPRPKVRDLSRRTTGYGADTSQEKHGYEWIYRGYVLV